MNRALSLCEAADILRCSTAYLARAVKRGDLKALRLGRFYRIFNEDLADFIKSKRYVPIMQSRKHRKSYGQITTTNMHRICEQARKEVLNGR